MSTSKDTPISTPELLELILAQLPIRDLLVTAPLVCTLWQSTTLSPTLQRALFFEPDPSSDPPIQNPLLVEVFPPFFAPADEGSTVDSVMAMPWSKAPDAFKRAEASWRRMLVIQPPAQRVSVTETRHHWDAKSERQGTCNGPDLMLRMGLLYDLAVLLIDRRRSSFCIHWNESLTHLHDVVLAVSHPKRRPSGGPGPLDERFYSDGFTSVEIDFRKWVRRGSGQMMGYTFPYTHVFDDDEDDAPEWEDEPVYGEDEGDEEAESGDEDESDDEEANRNATSPQGQ
ncbi:hypothetical protein DFH07DRAFT_796782 [Mycena maculata]|uniref:F-box domain-containing protein n=1 Tax=Mycena maculata TaxID=230809 RepID=A0AAD7K4A6_9AGAR|nr:hypothetical protein DFH07DRAFT_796782 [Mycena maculata]